LAIAVVTGVFTLLGVAGGGIASWLLANQARREDREERRRTDARALVVELLDAGGQWASVADGFVLAVATVSDPVTLTNLDSFVTYTEAKRRFDTALVTARLVISEEGDLRSSLLGLTALADDFVTALGAVGVSASNNGRADVEVLGVASGKVGRIKHGLEHLEAVATTRFG
jgi:hypothetical protein